MIDYDIIFDTSHLDCPLPIVETKKKLADMTKGQVIKVICADPALVIDFESLIAVSGDTLLNKEQTEGLHIFFIKKA